MGIRMPGVSGNSETRDPDVRDPLPLSLAIWVGARVTVICGCLYRVSPSPSSLSCWMVKLNTQIMLGLGRKPLMEAD